MRVMMRILIVLSLLGSFAAAAPYGYGFRSGRCGPVHQGFRYHAKYVGCTQGFRYHPKYVPYRYSCAPYRGYYRPYRSHYRYGSRYGYRRYYPRYFGYGYGYGYGCYGYRYRYRAYRPYLAFSPIYSRIMTVLTIDDEEFDGPAAAPAPADHDGLPRPRREPVGARFLVDVG